MNYNIRPYKESDFETIHSWWIAAGECPPARGMMISNGTFVLEVDGVPALTQTVLLTQSKELCYLEGIAKNPEFKESLESLIPPLWETVFQYAKDRGYKNILGYCKVEKLKNKYQKLGLVKVMDNLSAFTREL
jgi:hypothetical protein